VGADRLRGVKTPATATERDLAAYGEIARQSLFFASDRPLESWFDRIGRENVRFALAGADVAGGLAIYRGGQFFGGRRLDCGLIAAVAVAPEHRAHGVGTRLMRETIQELQRGGTPLACLFPATLPVYRKAGFEYAGVFSRFKVSASLIDSRAREPEVWRAKGDLRAVRELYARAAAGKNGWLDRPEVLWKRNLEPWAGESLCYLVGPPEHPEGYTVYTQATEGAVHRIQVHDLVAETRRAADRLLAFFAAHRSMVETVVFPDGPGTPFLSCLPEPALEVARFVRWMLRVVDVRAALAERGYPAGCSGELHLEIADALVAPNAGRWILEVSGGRGRVRPGGRGDLAIDIRGLAALYTGHATTGELAVLGLASGSQPLADAFFAGPAPWMPDMF
jgi:predicted acetyltransferase